MSASCSRTDHWRGGRPRRSMQPRSDGVAVPLVGRAKSARTNRRSSGVSTVRRSVGPPQRRRGASASTHGSGAVPLDERRDVLAVVGVGRSAARARSASTRHGLDRARRRQAVLDDVVGAGPLSASSTRRGASMSTAGLSRGRADDGSRSNSVGGQREAREHVVGRAAIRPATPARGARAASASSSASRRRAAPRGRPERDAAARGSARASVRPPIGASALPGSRVEPIRACSTIAAPLHHATSPTTVHRRASAARRRRRRETPTPRSWSSRGRRGTAPIARLDAAGPAPAGRASAESRRRPRSSAGCRRRTAG